MKRLPLIFTLVVLAWCLGLEFTRLTRKPWPPRHFENIEMEFKYGSVGAEVNGYPFLIWRELPTIFRDHLPGGWKDFGFIFEPGRDLPIGISVRRTGVERVGFNCGTCHTATVSAGGKTTLILGAPAQQLNLQSYLAFVDRASRDPALTADAVFDSAAAAGRPFAWYNKLIFRYFVFPRLDQEAAGLHAGLAWMARRPAHGPGRTDAGNFWRARWGLAPENDDKVGAVDFPSVWNQRVRLEGLFHWDGNNSSLTERNLSAALAGGAAEWLLERRVIAKLSDWLMELKPPVFPAAIDAEKARRGEGIYRREKCGDCHDPSGGRIGQVTPLTTLRTDPERNNLFSPQMVEYFHKVGSGYSWRFSHYRSTNGYANMPLDGVWARAPYLHNGSVPSLAALFTAEAERPRRFRRGCDTFDPVDVGFVCERGFEYDVQQRGNDNKGHNFATSLPPEEKSELIEYLKTL